jgi:hypothetical protein
MLKTLKNIKNSFLILILLTGNSFAKDIRLPKDVGSGIYHTKVSVWPMYHPDTPYPTQVVYYDEIRAGKSKKAVTKYLGN